MQGEWQGMNQEEGSGKLIVEFSMEPYQDEEASLKEGRPVFKEHEWVKIRVPGDKDNNVSRQVRPGDKERFPLQWAAFKNKQAQPIEGTLLSAVPFLTKAQVLEFQALGIQTAEQLRDLSDSNAQRIMGIASLKKRMADYLTAAKDSAMSQRLSVELQKRDEEIALLKQMIEEQAGARQGKSKQG